MRALQISYYCTLASYIFMVILVRYNNILNGYLVVIPLIAWSGLLIAVTLVSVSRKQTKGLGTSWCLAAAAIALIYVLVKYF